MSGFVCSFVLENCPEKKKILFISSSVSVEFNEMNHF